LVPERVQPMVDHLRDVSCLTTRTGGPRPAGAMFTSTSRGCCSTWTAKNAEKIAALVDVERTGPAKTSLARPWDHRPLVTVLVGQVVGSWGIRWHHRLRSSSFPKGGTVQWASSASGVATGQGRHLPGGVFMDSLWSRASLLDFRLSLPEGWTRDAPTARQERHVPPEVRIQTRHEQCLERLDAWGDQVPTAGDG